MMKLEGCWNREMQKGLEGRSIARTDLTCLSHFCMRNLLLLDEIRFALMHYSLPS